MVTVALYELKIKLLALNATEINNSYAKTDLTVIDCKGVEWIKLIQDSV
jgi:hypothetical protein